MMTKEMTKSLPVSKRMVYNSYLKVIAKDGSAGIDKQSIDMFNENLPKNLHKIWNRMTSGSYFPPPVRTWINYYSKMYKHETLKLFF
jgi:RNA-directed DNA polymerase